jgi:hypothetical protein
MTDSDFDNTTKQHHGVIVRALRLALATVEEFPTVGRTEEADDIRTILRELGVNEDETYLEVKKLRGSIQEAPRPRLEDS